MYQAVATLPDGTEIVLAEGFDYAKLRELINSVSLGTKGA